MRSRPSTLRSFFANDVLNKSTYAFVMNVTWVEGRSTILISIYQQQQEAGKDWELLYNAASTEYVQLMLDDLNACFNSQMTGALRIWLADLELEYGP